MFFGINFFNYRTTQLREVCGEGPFATHHHPESRKCLRINCDTRIRRVAAASRFCAAEQTGALAHGRRVRQPSWRSICINMGLFAIGAGLYCTYMYLQFSRLRRS